MKINCTKCKKAVFLGQCPCCKNDIYICTHWDNIFHHVYDLNKDCFEDSEKEKEVSHENEKKI